MLAKSVMKRVHGRAGGTGVVGLFRSLGGGTRTTRSSGRDQQPGDLHQQVASCLARGGGLLRSGGVHGESPLAQHGRTNPTNRQTWLRIVTTVIPYSSSRIRVLGRGGGTRPGGNRQTSPLDRFAGSGASRATGLEARSD